jgi:carbon monoxide dehydrogenase subunit G
MWFEMRREEMGFIGRASVVHTAEARVAAPRSAVFGAFVDPASWPSWFPSVRAVAYQTCAPYGVGTIRMAHVGITRWVEEIVAWDAERRWAWTVLRATVPLAMAQIESFEFADDGDGTRVRWTLALEPRLLTRFGLPFMGRTITRLLVRAAQNLEAHLRTGGIPVARATGS